MGIFDSRFPSNFKKPTSASASGLAAEDEESIETKTKAVKAAEKRSFEEEEEERRAICFFVFFGRRGSTSRRQFRNRHGASRQVERGIRCSAFCS